MGVPQDMVGGFLLGKIPFYKIDDDSGNQMRCPSFSVVIILLHIAATLSWLLLLKKPDLLNLLNLLFPLG